MDKSPNWCPICKKETDWLIVPQNPRFVQCRECGHLKKYPILKDKKPKIEKLSEKQAITSQSLEPIADIGLALRVVLQSVLGGLVLGGFWLIFGYLFMAQGSFILATLFFILFGITASTIGVYFVLGEAEKIAEKKVKG
jgi:hypothetical protein